MYVGHLEAVVTAWRHRQRLKCLINLVNSVNKVLDLMVSWRFLVHYNFDIQCMGQRYSRFIEILLAMPIIFSYLKICTTYIYVKCTNVAIQCYIKFPQIIPVYYMQFCNSICFTTKHSEDSFSFLFLLFLFFNFLLLFPFFSFTLTPHKNGEAWRPGDVEPATWLGLGSAGGETGSRQDEAGRRRLGRVGRGRREL